MSSTAAPISAANFAEAIQDLPLGNLHSKAAEIRNSLQHLLASNQQLQTFADEGDQDCVEALQENVDVLARMESRVSLLRQEVERRGFMWAEVAPGIDEQQTINGLGEANGLTDSLGDMEAGRPSTNGQSQAYGSQQQAGGGMTEANSGTYLGHRSAEGEREDPGMHL